MSFSYCIEKIKFYCSKHLSKHTHAYTYCINMQVYIYVCVCVSKFWPCCAFFFSIIRSCRVVRSWAVVICAISWLYDFSFQFRISAAINVNVVFINSNLTQFHNTQSKSSRFCCCSLFFLLVKLAGALSPPPLRAKESEFAALCGKYKNRHCHGEVDARQTPFRVVNLSRMPQIRRLNVAAIFAELIVFVFSLSPLLVRLSLCYNFGVKKNAWELIYAELFKWNDKTKYETHTHADTHTCIYVHYVSLYRFLCTHVCTLWISTWC